MRWSAAARSSGPAVLTVGPLSLDSVRHEVSSDQGVLDLTAREFALLEYLMRRQGEVVTRGDMLDNIWDYAYDGLSNVVDVYIGYLRRKLRQHGLESMVRTIRGVGYRMDPPEQSTTPSSSAAAIPADAHA